MNNDQRELERDLLAEPLIGPGAGRRIGGYSGGGGEIQI